jgi:hypothetical protein
MPQRDRETGRFRHVWDYVGVIDREDCHGEVGRCDLPSCGKYRITVYGSCREINLTRAAFARRFPEEAKIM